MGNVIGSFFSGLAGVINKLLGSPLDFLSGKSGSSLCGPTWDLFCYINNFCFSHLLKLATVSLLVYFVLLFFSLVYPLGICQCICCVICRVMWACLAIWFSIIEYVCTFLCYKLPRIKRTPRRHKLDIEDFSPSSPSEDDDNDKQVIGKYGTYPSRLHRKMADKRPGSRHWRNYRGDRMRKSLWPESHWVRVGIGEKSVHLKKRNSMQYGRDDGFAHNIKVTRTTQFAQKGANYKGSDAKRRKM